MSSQNSSSVIKFLIPAAFIGVGAYLYKDQILLWLYPDEYINVGGVIRKRGVTEKPAYQYTNQPAQGRINLDSNGITDRNPTLPLPTQNVSVPNTIDLPGGNILLVPAPSTDSPWTGSGLTSPLDAYKGPTMSGLSGSDLSYRGLPDTGNGLSQRNSPQVVGTIDPTVPIPEVLNTIGGTFQHLNEGNLSRSYPTPPGPDIISTVLPAIGQTLSNTIDQLNGNVSLASNNLPNLPNTVPVPTIDNGGGFAY